jgi:PRTRC genetic system protein B
MRKQNQKTESLPQTQLYPEKLGDAGMALLFLDGQYLVQYRDKERLHQKFVSPRAVRAAFSKEKIDTGWIPEGVIRWGFAANGEWFVQYHEAKSYRIPLIEKDERPATITAKLPALLFIGYARDYYLFALKARPAPGARVCAAPLPNVGSDGHICFGANKVPAASLSNIADAWKIFWSAPFNNHMSNDKSVAFKDDVRLQLRAVAKSKWEYPADDLRTTGYTVDSMVSRIIKRVGL